MYTANENRYESMQYNRCGKSGLKLPAVSLGLWHNFGDNSDYDNMVNLCKTAFDNGITHFDLANNYGPVEGAAESNFGKILKDNFASYRDEMIISTKAGYYMWPGPYGDWGSRKYLFASLEQSLKRMKLDYVDLFYSHRYDPVTPLEETLQALVDIVKQGKALYVGISRWPLEALKTAKEYLAARDVPLLIYQDKLNLIEHEPLDNGVLDYCAENGIGFISFSPLAQGLLTDRYLNGIPDDSRMTHSQFLRPENLTPELLAKLCAMSDEAQKNGQSLSDAALQWILHQRGTTSVLVGVSKVEQMEKNIKAVLEA